MIGEFLIKGFKAELNLTVGSIYSKQCRCTNGSWEYLHAHWEYWDSAVFICCHTHTHAQVCARIHTHARWH